MPRPSLLDAPGLTGNLIKDFGSNFYREFLRQEEMDRKPARPVTRPQPDLLPSQARAMAVQARELLIRKEPGSGASYLLRRMAVARAAAGASVLLVSPDDRSLRVDHLDDHGRRTSLWRMVEGEPCQLLSGEVKWRRGGSVRAATWDSAAKRAGAADILLLDDADQLAFGSFQDLRESVLRAPSQDSGPRVVVVADRPDEGWVSAHFRELPADQGSLAQLLAAEMPDVLRSLAIARTLPAFEDYIGRVLPTAKQWLGRRYWRQMVEAAQRVADGEIRRLMFMGPSRIGKSFLWCRLFPAYLLDRRPAEMVACITAEQTLANQFSSDARELYRNGGGSFRIDSQEKRLWRTKAGGGMWARGLDAAQLGQGFTTAVLSDLFGSEADGRNKAKQDAVEEYFFGTFASRQDFTGEIAVAAIVVEAQRLAVGDLQGRILKREEDAETRSTIPWTVMDFPLEGRRRRKPLPQSCAVIEPLDNNGQPLGEGAPLAPDLVPEDIVREAKKHAVNWASTKQQEPIEKVVGALWDMERIEAQRVSALPKGVDLVRVVVGVDPSGSSSLRAAECGIVVCGKGTDGHGYCLADVSMRGTPAQWGSAAVLAYHANLADILVAEINFGGEMVEHVIGTVDPKVKYEAVHAARGKIARAEPIAALDERLQLHMNGSFPELEGELCSYVAAPGQASPNRYDAFVWAMSKLMLEEEVWFGVSGGGAVPFAPRGWS